MSIENTLQTLQLRAAALQCEIDEAPDEEAKASKRELEMANQLIESLASDFEPERYRDEYRERVLELIERKAGKFTPDQFEDHYATALRELVQKKLKGHKIKAPHEEASPGGAKVIDLMSALKKSIGEGSGKAKSARAATRRAQLHGPGRVGRPRHPGPHHQGLR